MIVTFYSYKGGVGRSMALANVADLFARSGLKVLIVDFDLEAPGLEHYFPIDHEEVRGHEGLLDLLLTFKYSMSTAATGAQERDAFRRLDRFLATVYPVRDGGGGIDILPAGQRSTDDQLARYGEELRRFDWADFYYSWSGELFFEWLRRSFEERYDVVLVDSRTGLTEIGGVCAYQLADVIVALCAPNLQNLDGTLTMVRSFRSPRAQAVRRDRPVEVLVVPSRVDEGDEALESAFRRRFEERFAADQPTVLGGNGHALWDMRIPYDPRYSYDEQVITDPGRAAERRGLASAYGRLLEGIALLAPDGSGPARLRPSAAEAAPVLTEYDPTTRFAAPDVFLTCEGDLDDEAMQIRERLRTANLRVAISADPGEGALARPYRDLAQSAQVILVLLGRDRRLTRTLLDIGPPVLLALLPGAPAPSDVAGIAVVDLRDGDDGWDGLASRVLGMIKPAQAPAPPTAANPYPGMAPFGEAHHDVFVGRAADVEALVQQIRSAGACTVLGSAGVGKTSLIFAGLVPRLRRGALEGSETWAVTSLRPGASPSEALAAAIATCAGVEDGTLDDIDAVIAGLRGRFPRVVLVVDQMEELFTVAWPGERDRFVTSFSQLLRKAGDLLVPVLALRTDFLSNASNALDQRFLRDPVLIRPLGGNALRSVIELPARRAGVALEPGLTDRLLRDVTDEPGALALLQFVLDRLWRDQRDGYLTHAAYAGMGGVANALATSADETVKGLSPTERELARPVLLGLVEIRDGQIGRRRPVEIGDLAPSQAPDYRRVVERLIGQRLLAESVEQGSLQVELSHESLVRAWPRLRDWIEADRAAVGAHTRLEAAAREWSSARRDSGALLSRRLAELLVSTSRDIPITRLAEEFVTACRAADRRQRTRALLAAGTTFLSLLATLWVSAGSTENALAALVEPRSLVILAIGVVVITVAYCATRRMRLP